MYLGHPFSPCYLRHYWRTTAFLREHDIVINVENRSFLAEKAKPGDTGCTCETRETK